MSSGGPRRPLGRIDGYELLAECGRGGMGCVYRARQVRLERDVALKLLASGAVDTPLRRRALDLDPDSAMLRNNRGYRREKLGDVQGALSDYAEALRRDPELNLARSNRASLLQQLGRTKEALAEWTALLERRPDGAPEAWARRGLLHAQTGDLEAAERDLSRALEMVPDLLMGLINRGRVRLLRDDHAGALADLERARDLDPDNPVTWLNLAHLRRAQGDPRAALGDVERCLELAPRYPEARELQAQLQREVGE